MKGKLIIFSAPSGSGKTTIVRHLLDKYTQQLAFSVSACTRPRREYEIDGKDYYFLTLQDFRQKIADQQFAEWEEVYAGNYYGTLKAEIQRLWNEGKHVLFDVDVKGGLKLKEAYGDAALAVFVKVTSDEEIKRRLSGRGTETEETLATRLAKVRYEQSFEHEFDVVLVNDELNETLTKAEDLVQAFIQS
ncbi:guanylate kinase [Dyadobacter sp. BE34]|uniref:Guanylate kinase n=1 Tax=Dyadobacter fermentans TaxID=94254 RepID=A0ABU1R7Q6_9BACT|nr:MULTISPECIES: guanylate kinase [Dyadobacter]MDR6809267.1 guanylate kinase [Dyadobacter fermentans]MDR7047139.1 guanylate kinase [Dyadobacter sp. BE242]MDR7194894.1 guanylate kinase [Dyadobacter sp. BE34]MDR7214561.1 guanylate kinase [Dyadobacter sp. BE31]MDR7266816.1 guanylate kinase [Dyadobacter sp. BE32]